MIVYFYNIGDSIEPVGVGVSWQSSCSLQGLLLGEINECFSSPVVCIGIVPSGTQKAG